MNYQSEMLKNRKQIFEMEKHKFFRTKDVMSMPKHKLKPRQRQLEKHENQIIQSSYRNDAQSSERLDDNQSAEQ